MKRFNVIFTATGTNHGDFDTLAEAQAKLTQIKVLIPDGDFHILDLFQVFK